MVNHLSLLNYFRLVAPDFTPMPVYEARCRPNIARLPVKSVTYHTTGGLFLHGGERSS